MVRPACLRACRTMCPERTPAGLVPAEGLLGAARLAPSGSPFGRSTSLRDVVEPCLFVCRGFEFADAWLNEPARGSQSFLNLVCRLRDYSALRASPLRGRP